MESNVIDKLKKGISKNFLLNFNKEELTDFLPIMQKDNVAFVAIAPNARKDHIAQLMKQKGYGIKFFQISQEGLSDLKNYAFSKIESQIEEEGVFIEEDKSNTTSAVEMTSLSEIKVEKSKHKRIGEILIDKGFIDHKQLLTAISEGRKTKTPLGSMLYKLNYITLEQLKEALGEQMNVEITDIDKIEVNDDVMNILPEDFVKNNRVIPISTDGRNLLVGMTDPNNERVLKDIIYLTGLKPRATIITYVEFQNFIDSYYTDSKRETDEIIQKLEEVAEDEIEETIWEQAERDIQDDSGTVAKFVNKIVTNAIDNGVSDIHIEPRLSKYIVRYRKDGILRNELDLPTKVEQSIITRFKVLARMDISEHRRSQDGMFSMKYKGSTYDFRMNTLPVGGKEKMVIRILAPAVSLESSNKEIQLNGSTDADIEKIKKMVSSPNGIILSSGPTGSGKTTTLYTILKSLNKESVNITTIEDPVEIRLEGVNQSQINAKAGITFASVMRAILRQDPDIILVGEIRDYETLEVAISAALTGHLVLSTVHTNSASTTITRLIEMGAKDYLVSATLSGVIAQRLVRKLCPHCREEYYPTMEEASEIFIDPVEAEKFTKTKIYKPVGCQKCNFTGYEGRFGIYEILPINKEIKKLIANGAPDIEIEDAAIACGMKTLAQSCLGHILKGETSIEEFIRTLGIVSE